MYYKLGDIYNKDLSKKTVTNTNVLVLHQQKDQRTGQEKRNSIRRKNRRMTRIINLARKNLAQGKIIKVGSEK